MIALSCGIHEATRAMPCPICPRVLAELRKEAAGVHQSFAPIGGGKRPRSANTQREVLRLAKLGRTAKEIANALGIATSTVKSYGAGHIASGAKHVDYAEVIRRAKAGQYAPEIAKALGICETTAQRIGRGHFVPRAVKPPRPDASYIRKNALERDEVRRTVDARLRAGWTTSTICRRLGVSKSFVGLRRKALAAQQREAA